MVMKDDGNGDGKQMIELDHHHHHPQNSTNEERTHPLIDVVFIILTNVIYAFK